MEEIKTLPDFFPSTVPKCKEVSARFFFCFTSKGRKIAGNDGGAAQRGLAECQKELHAYMSCMKAHGPKN